MAEEYFEKTTKKSTRWFRAFVVLALLYGLTFSLNKFFNWLFFFGAAYSLFMSYFTLPVQPKVFQQRQKSTYNDGGPASYTPPSSSTSSQLQPDRVKKIVRIIWMSFLGLFALLFVIGIFSGNDEDQTVNSSDDSSYESNEQPAEQSEIEKLTYKGNEYIEDDRPDSADVYYDKALAIDPNYMMAIYGKGLVLYNKGNPDDAHTYFVQAYDGGYRFWWLSWILADGYDKSGATERAVELYKESIGLDSTATASYNRLAELDPDNRDKYLQLSQKHPSD